MKRKHFLFAATLAVAGFMMVAADALAQLGGGFPGGGMGGGMGGGRSRGGASRDRLAALEEVADAAKAFYALLTPEQQALADPRLAALVPGRGGAYQPLPPRSSASPPKAGTGY